MSDGDPEYSRTVPLDEITDERLEAMTEYYSVVDTDGAVDALEEDPVIEVGREDSPLGTGRRAVIRPCPLCGEEHTHKFGEDLEEGKLVRKASECPETELYWLVWFGEGEGKWHDDDRCEDEPRME